MPKPDMDLKAELAELTDDDTANGLMAIMDLHRDYSPGQLARWGAAVSKLGSRITEHSRNDADRLDVYADLNVQFQRRVSSGKDTVSFDTELAKREFPESKYPKFWKHTPTVAGVTTIAVSLPFA